MQNVWMRQLLLVASLASFSVAQDAQRAPDFVAGSQGRSLQVGKRTRTYRLYIPTTYDGKSRVPLLIFLHGRGSNGRTGERYGFNKLADKDGFVAAYPDALGNPRSWEPGYFGRKKIDLEFLRALIKGLEEELRIDSKRIFCCGHSSGGIMSYAVASHLGDKVAAVGVVAGTVGVTQGRGKPLRIPELKRPVSAIVFHCRDDRIVPYDRKRGKGARWNFFVSAPDSVDYLVECLACDGKPTVADLFEGNVKRSTWKNAKRGVEVVFYDIEEGGHGWPRAGRRGRPELPSATQEMWRFFSKHAKPGAKKAVDSKPANPTKRKKD